MSKRIICADAVTWLKNNKQSCAVVTSLPDPEEIGASIKEWRSWFINAAMLSMKAANEDAPIIFYQTDRKHAGEIHSKAGLLLDAANKAGVSMLWHKIVLRRDVGSTDLHRPGYTHLMAFSKAARPGTATPDVMKRGKMIYPNAMGIIPAVFAVKYAGDRNKTIIDPFCGRGTVPAVADALGFDSIGVDIDKEQCKKAERLVLSLKGFTA